MCVFAVTSYLSYEYTAVLHLAPISHTFEEEEERTVYSSPLATVIISIDFDSCTLLLFFLMPMLLWQFLIFALLYLCALLFLPIFCLIN